MAQLEDQATPDHQCENEQSSKARSQRMCESRTLRMHDVMHTGTQLTVKTRPPETQREFVRPYIVH